MRTNQRRWSGWLIAAMSLGVLRACVFGPEIPPGPCTDDASCDDGNPCTKDGCSEDGYCDYQVLAAPPEGSCADDNPCTKEACDADGKCTNVADTSLLPADDGNECTVESCTENGVAQSGPMSDGSPCGAAGQLKCVAGQCKCAAAAECGADTACVVFTCANSACGSTNVPKDTLVNEADPNDCKKNVCDGAGNIASVQDAEDAPADDGNVCTLEGCNGLEPINHVPVTDGTACGLPQTCTSDGVSSQTTTQTCNAGVCGTPMAVSCGNYACNAAMTSCLATCQAQAECIASAYCDAAATCVPKLNPGAACTDALQCISGICVDGVCCNTSCAGACESCKLPGLIGACSFVPSGMDPDGECAGMGSGSQLCNGAGDCDEPLGKPCSANGSCLNNICVDGVCCNTTCTGPCKSCLGSQTNAGVNGTCSNIKDNTDPDNECTAGTGVCNGNGACK